jgi:hypothetical protein
MAATGKTAPSSIAAQRENIKVVCRVRPRGKRESREGDEICVTYAEGSIEVFNAVGQYPFDFDRVFAEVASQREIFEYCAVPLLEDVLRGFNATICAYGQTGSGRFRQ